MARTALKLNQEDIITVFIDLTSIGSQNVTAEQWYLGILTQIESRCMLETEVLDWWQNHISLAPAQRFSNYITEILLKEISQPIVVFVDEIDSTLGLGFTDDFFAAIRAFHNRRSIDTELYRISFVLLGVATPDELIADRARTPFNIGQAVELTDFGQKQVERLVAPLQLADETMAAVQQILSWTGGQPYLTQKLSTLLAEDKVQVAELDKFIAANWLGDKFKGDSHFKFITGYLADTPTQYKKEVFETYESCYRGIKMPCRDASLAHNRHRLSGLLKRNEGQLIHRNEIYRKLIDWKWINENRPTFWTERNKKRILWLISIVSLVTAGGMLYLWLLTDRLATEATSLRLQVEAQAILLDAMPGTDMLAIQKSAAAYRIIEKANHFYGNWLSLDVNKTLESIQNTFETHNKNLWIATNSSSINSIGFSSDGKYLVSGSVDNSLRLWDVATGRAIGSPLNDHEALVTSVVFSPNGKRLVTGSSDQTLRLWDTATGQSICSPLKGHKAVITSVAFSPDGQRIVSGSEDKTLRLWDAATGAAIDSPLKGHEEVISRP